ncbi:hypothetical protein FJTKL_06298 [Diaporthe vaccinii]|uniref:Sterol methyltransferase C-terminal domain-containing protein n=1 Tax=Diaporthe vaccinii TaxID=105482 RepID=A0ABR4DR96_9PEZI
MAALETLRLAPPGTKKTGDSLSKAAEALVLGGKERLFTPMFLMRIVTVPTWVIHSCIPFPVIFVRKISDAHSSVLSLRFLHINIALAKSSWYFEGPALHIQPMMWTAFSAASSICTSNKTACEWFVLMFGTAREMRLASSRVANPCKSSLA